MKKIEKIKKIKKNSKKIVIMLDFRTSLSYNGFKGLADWRRIPKMAGVSCMQQPEQMLDSLSEEELISYKNQLIKNINEIRKLKSKEKNS